MPEKHLIPTIARAPAIALPLAATLLLCAGGAQAVSRTFVSGFGSDANTSVNCGPTAPCRSFAAALTKTDPGGEIVVKDSAGYGPPFTISQSVSITAPDGVYAGISMGGYAIGIEIIGSGLAVKLKGLRISGGGTFAIQAVTGPAASTLDIEDCVIVGTDQGTGIPLTEAIDVNGPLNMHIGGSAFYNSSTGIKYFMPSASSGLVTVERSSFVNVGIGVDLYSFSSGSVLSARIADSSVTGYSVSLAFYSHGGAGISEINVERTTISGASGLLVSTDSTGTAYGSITSSFVSDCSYAVGSNSTLAPGLSTEVVAATGNTFVRCGRGVANTAARVTLKNNLITQMSTAGIDTSGGSIAMDGNTISESPVGIELVGTLGSTSFASTGNNVFFNNTTDLGAGITLGPVTVH